MASLLRKICGLTAVLLVMPVSVDAYTITYNLNGGVNDPDNPTSYASDTSKFELKAPSRDGVAFLGWYIDSYLNGKETYYERSNFAKFQKKKKNYIANNLGNFTVTARWGLIPQTPKQDERGCYLIHDGAELYGLASVADTNPSTYAYEFNGCISLQNDIVVNKNLLNEKGEIALDNYVWWIQLNFNGTFDGNGYKISGLRGDDGFFLRIGDNLRSAKPSYVRNLGITDSYFSASTAGAVAGIVYNSARISNVYTDASVHGANMAGGLFGEIYAMYDECLVTDYLPAQVAPVSAKSQDELDEPFIENAYSLGHVEGVMAGGITAKVTLAILRNVYFAGELKGKNTDCIFSKRESLCTIQRASFALENALCMDSKDTSVSKATSLSKEQFADGTALNILSKNDDLRWTQKIGTDPHPVFDGVKVEIRYVLNGGENNEKNPRYFTVGDKPIALSEPQKANDVFEGWFLDSAFTNKVDSIDTRNLDDRILYAKWKSRFIITLEMGLYRGSYDKQYCYGSCKIEWSTDSSTFVLEKAYSDGYTFDGWYVDSLFTKEIKEIPEDNTEDITVYVKWKPVVYTITYHLVGGVNHPDNPTTYTVLESPKVKDPTREGAVFLSWRVEKPYEWGNPTWPEPPTNRDYYAQWIPVPQEPLKDSTGCYLVTSKEELYWIEKSADRKLCASLQNDIVVNENMIKDSKLNLDTNSYFVWRPIEYFEGKFLGNGHSISGLYLKSDDGYETYDAYKYGGLFKSVQKDAKVFNVEINDSYCDGFVEHLVIASVVNNKIALPKTSPKSAWRIAVSGNVVAMFGLKPGKTLLVMDVQGRVLRKLRTESSMNIDFPSAGRFLVRYGNETKAISIR